MFNWLRYGLAIAIVGASLTPAPSRADDRSAIKAALVFNIIRFVTFPGDPKKLRVCGIASDPTVGDLRRLDGRTVGSARIEVVIVGSISASCDVVYLDSAAPRDVGGVSRGQILIGAARSFAEQGGTVGLINFGGQIRFVINSGAARRANVNISSQLMQLAAKVIS